MEAMEDAVNKFRYYSEKLEEMKLENKQDNIYNILLQNSLFESTGIDIKTIKSVCLYSDTFIRKTLKEGVEKGLIEVTKVSKRLTYTLKLDVIDGM